MINKDVMVKFLAVAAAVVLIKAAMLVQFPDYFAALAERLIDPNQQFPTKVRIREVQAPERVARGDAVPVAVFLDESSELPEAPGTLVFHTLQEGTDIPVELVADADGAYRGALAKALEDMRVMAKLGDGQSEWVDVKVLPRPEVQDGTIRFKPPEYAKLEQSAPEKFGGMTALLGSSAEIEIQTNKPLTACVLKRMDERDFPLVKTDAEGKAWRLAEPMPIDKSTSFYMDLTDQDGLKNSQPPVVYPINAKPDQQPLIKLRKPTRDKTVTPRARIDVVFDVRDDYGVRTVWLCFRIQHESEATEGVGQSRRYELPLPEKLKGQRNIGELPFNWDLEALNLKVGDQVIFWLEADDDCASNNIPPTRARGDKDEPAKPQEEEFPRSADVKLSVISKEDKIAELQALVARLYEQVRGLNDRQKELKDELMKLIEGAQNEIKKESN
ncbi:MAG: hypothetical protein M5U26_22720 [Planctomycetota bacterium]|nr:hypothetical protein [Planctomycetota bacterium]